MSGKLLCIALLVLNGFWTEPTEWILLVSSVYFMTQVSVGSLLNAGRTRLELMFNFSSKKLLCSTYVHPLHIIKLKRINLCISCVFIQGECNFS